MRRLLKMRKERPKKAAPREKLIAVTIQRRRFPCRKTEHKFIMVIADHWSSMFARSPELTVPRRRFPDTSKTTADMILNGPNEKLT